MKKRPSSKKQKTSALSQRRKSNPLSDLFPDTLPPLGVFLGTDNPRYLRALEALESSPRMREELDRIAGCSNGPDLISQLRDLGLEVPCVRLHRIDIDGKKCRPGQFHLSDSDRILLQAWRQKGRP